MPKKPLFTIPKRTALLQFEGDFEGAEVEVNLRAPLLAIFGIQEALAGEEPRLAYETFAKTLISWNLADELGKPIPASAEGLEQLPLDFGKILLTTWLKEVITPSAPLAASSGDTST